MQGDDRVKDRTAARGQEASAVFLALLLLSSMTLSLSLTFLSLWFPACIGELSRASLQLRDLVHSYRLPRGSGPTRATGSVCSKAMKLVAVAPSFFPDAMVQSRRLPAHAGRDQEN